MLFRLLLDRAQPMVCGCFTGRSIVLSLTCESKICWILRFGPSSAYRSRLNESDGNDFRHRSEKRFGCDILLHYTIYIYINGQRDVVRFWVNSKCAKRCPFLPGPILSHNSVNKPTSFVGGDYYDTTGRIISYTTAPDDEIPHPMETLFFKCD